MGAEDWLSMQWAFLQGVNSLLLTLRRIEKGQPPLASTAPTRAPTARRS
ncbi:MAG: hypothetical protein U0R68_16920 [Candidatus Nanopelagicales bacterium]